MTKSLLSLSRWQGDALDANSLGLLDVAGCFDVLEHIPDDQRALEELARAVRPGGGLILTVPQLPRLWPNSRTLKPLVKRLQASLLLALRPGGQRVTLNCLLAP
jgi:2-polyprenyl-3-methyl-5-hydroxy-6-metoxy-1,4-benzoquinol methylase